MYTFRVEASLNGNKGVPGVTRLYVGNDVPSAPAEVKLGDAEISWTPVTGGASNGYVDLSAITYEVYLNDQLVGTTAASSLAYSLDPEKEVDAYRAGVVAVAAGKRSEKTVSEKRILGKPLQLPVTIVPTAHQADLVTVFNLDGSPDYGVWTASDLWGDLCFSSGWSYEQPDDWLILPATEFPTADVQYSLSIEAARGGSIGPREYFEVWAGNAPDPAAMTIPVMSKTRAKKYGEWNEHSTTFAVPEAGTYYIAVRSVSDPDQKALLVRNIRVDATNQSTVIPMAVSGLEVIASSDADLTATLRFTMPDKYINGATIAADTDLTAVINGTSEVEVQGKPGSVLTVTVPTSQGDNYITVAVRIGDRTGQSAETTVFTGMDMLSFVENYTSVLSEDNMSIRLSWEAPAESLNGGYFTRTGITYWVCDINTDGTVIGDMICAGTDVFEYTLTLPAGTPQRNMRIAVVAENAAGLSNARWYIAQIAGEPYILPMDERFDNMTATYSPLVAQATSQGYPSGSWTWSRPELVHPDFQGASSDFALTGYTDEESGAQVRMRLPKFSTEGLDKAAARFEIWTGHSSPSQVNIYALTHGMTSPEKIGTLAGGDGWSTITVDIPESYMGRKWMNLYIDGILTSDDCYLMLSGYSIGNFSGLESPAGSASAITAADGTVRLCGFNGQPYVIVMTDGRTVASGIANELTAVPLSPGLYIVKAAGTSARVLIR